MVVLRQLQLSVASVLRNKSTFLFLPNRRFSSSSVSDEELAQARKWLSSFTPRDLPRKSCKITFSRSSGSGGQNVNKLNTKATLRLDLKAHGHLINPYILGKVRQKSTYITKHDELVIHCDTYRSQTQNTEECFQRLYSAIANAVKLPGETLEKTNKVLAKIEKKSKKRQLKEKRMYFGKKGATPRRSPRGG